LADVIGSSETGERVLVVAAGIDRHARAGRCAAVQLTFLVFAVPAEGRIFEGGTD
jgi:hypothetical protein